MRTAQYGALPGVHIGVRDDRKLRFMSYDSQAAHAICHTGGYTARPRNFFMSHVAFEFIITN